MCRKYNHFLEKNGPYKNMGGEFSKFGYDGIILPSKISKIYFLKNYDWIEYTVPEFKELMKNTKMK